jgi:hypothetical protein
MKMTKKDLERRNDFLLLQLKEINEIVKGINWTDETDVARRIGSIKCICDIEEIRYNLKFIEKHDKEYNLYNKTMNINDYLIDEKKGESL